MGNSLVCIPLFCPTWAWAKVTEKYYSDGGLQLCRTKPEKNSFCSITRKGLWRCHSGISWSSEDELHGDLDLAGKEDPAPGPSGLLCTPAWFFCADRISLALGPHRSQKSSSIAFPPHERPPQTRSRAPDFNVEFREGDTKYVSRVHASLTCGAQETADAKSGLRAYLEGVMLGR